MKPKIKYFFCAVILTAGKELRILQQNNASSFPAVRMTDSSFFVFFEKKFNTEFFNLQMHFLTEIKFFSFTFEKN